MPMTAMMPLAQMNSTTAPAGGGVVAPSAPVVAPVVPVAPVPHPTVEAPPAGGGLVAGGGAGGAATQGVASQPLKDEGKVKPDSPFSFFGMPLLILMFIALYFFMTRGQKKEEKRRKSLLLEMKKGDKVQTIGGLVARVMSIDNDEVVLKVDESANVKAVYKKSAILTVIVPADEKAK